MSISSAMLAGISGLISNSSALASISNNIANVNTVGYKKMDTEFQDLVTSQASSGAYTAGGVQAVTNQLVEQQGGTRQTGSSTDLAISGQGFFVTTTSPNDNSITAPRNFTRAGSFTKDDQGYLHNAAGYYLQGWLADSNGNIASDPSDVTKLKTINVNSLAGAAAATTAVSVNANLNASQALNPAVGDPTATPPVAATYDAASTTESMANYDAASGTGVKPDWTIPVTVTDSQGGRHGLEMRLLKSSTPNQWNYELVSTDGALVGGTPLHDGQVAVGKLAFSSTGQLDLADSTGFPNPSNPVLTIGASSATAPAAGAIQWATKLGVAGGQISLDLGDAPGGLTQFASPSITTATSDNGVVYGNLTSVDVDGDGYVTAKYDNGITRKIAQVAVATFANADGLKAVSGDAWQVSLSSGTYTLKEPGTGGAGSISPSSLENSTVDLSTEFTGLITTQRAYSAASKIITTGDQMLQELINIKQ